jgi:hypothetical protein
VLIHERSQRERAVRTLLALTALALAGCGEELVEPGRLQLVAGPDGDPWAEVPTPVKVVSRKETLAGELAWERTGPAPLKELSMGAGGAGHFDVTGLDLEGTARVRARSVAVDPAGFAGARLPLFAARAGAPARAPGVLAGDLGTDPRAETVAGRYLVLVGGGGAELVVNGYDLATWQPIDPPPPLSCGAQDCTPRSLAVAQGSVVLALGAGWGFWFDPIVGDSSAIAPPDGLSSFETVAGGSTVTAPDGTAYVVGGTRGSAPSADVLVVGSDGALSHLGLTSARQGAAAAWVAGRGLVVVGGGDAASAGAELLAEGAQAFVPLSLPPDATRGAALLALDATRVLRLGGQLAGAAAASVELALGCAVSCAGEPAGDTVSLTEASAFSLGGGRAVVAGRNAAGETELIRWDAGTTAPLALREPRAGAVALRMPTGHIGVAGGVLSGTEPARSLELHLE